MINERLQELRKYLKLSQEEISAQIGVSYRAYTSYERGDRKTPLDFLESLFNQFDVNLNWLITGKGNMFNTTQFEQVQDEFAQKVKEILKDEGLI